METKQFKSCRLLEIKILDNSGDFFSFEGYASTFGNIDRGGDVINRGAFLDSINELKFKASPIPNTEHKALMPILWQHNMGNPIGSFIDIREDAKGLFVSGIMPKDDEFVKTRVIPQMKVGSVSDMSIGFMASETDFEDDIRVIKKATLFETSLVTIPMNEEANITAVAFKSAHPDLTDDEKNAIDCVEKYYEKIGQKSPFVKSNSICVDDIKSHTDRELETLLKDGVKFSKKSAKAIVSALNAIDQRDAELKAQRDAELKDALDGLNKSINKNY